MIPSGFLYHFFERLRTELGIELGIGEYFLLLEAIHLGYDPTDTTAMYQLCHRLWLKDIDQEEAFHRLFTHLAKAEIAIAHITLTDALNTRQNPKSKTQNPSPVTQNPQPVTQNPSPKTPNPSTPKPPTPQTTLTPTYTSVELQIQFNEPIPEDLTPKDFFQKKYLMHTSYQPLTLRQMKQSWRFLRNKVASGRSNELDIATTIKGTAKTGLLEELHYLPDYKNKLQQFIFIDISKSMVAFRELGEQLVQAATESGTANNQVFYFEKTLDAPFYRNPDRTDGIQLEELYQLLPTMYANLLIFSDAGAATNRMDAKRMAKAWYFLRQLKKRVQHLVWLNPMPAKRWSNTAAERLAQLVPMFPCDRLGFTEAIKVLRGIHSPLNTKNRR
ncbi:MAG: hypothetical protein AAF798_08835 [Bacteroidota bacterium]